MSTPLAVLGTGLVTAVGMSAPAACAAIRAKVTNPRETRFMIAGDWLIGHQVPLQRSWGGAVRLAKMASRAIAESLSGVPESDWSHIPLLLCVAERQRPGRTDGLENELYLSLEAELGTRFAPQSAIVPRGRSGIVIALEQARSLVAGGRVPAVVIAGVDSLLTWPQLSALDRGDRLLSGRNSNGFIPGEAAGALVVGPATREPRLTCTGIGFGAEAATIDSGEPLRADGLVQAMRAALADAGRELHDVDFRITDVSGEQYYFKEATLAVARLLRHNKATFDIWHAAECIGEVGAAAGPVALAVADAAFRKGYAPGSTVLLHTSDDSGVRAAAFLSYEAG
ncbi:MAG: hypothetical protein ACREVV_07155 [Steroidobacteraceae bacterium]